MMPSDVQLVSLTLHAESLIARMARVSSSNPTNPQYSKLLGYLIEHKHWSPFEMAHMVLKITTSRAIAAQILRHRSFSFQELSQRYTSDIDAPTPVLGRRQSEKNRQSSTEPLSDPGQEHWRVLQEMTFSSCSEAYEWALKIGVSREQARMLLPLATPTTLYMAGSIRSWIHYIELRSLPDTQQEHREIALAAKGIFVRELPAISKALCWDVDMCIEENRALLDSLKERGD